MPTYVYKCPDCGHRFEKVQRITAEAKAKCPECEQDGCKRQVVQSTFHLKGSGWYATDYCAKQ